MTVRRVGLVAAGFVALAAAAASYAVTHQAHRVTATVRSIALGGAMHATVVLPPGYATSGKRYPVVYFLHGLPARPTAYRDVGWLADALSSVDGDAILVQPQGSRPGDTDPEYLDWGKGRNWETFVAKELPDYVDRHFRTIPTRQGRALVGLSAGGYGAVTLGFRHLDRFSVLESWSGYFHATDPSGTAAISAPAGTNVHSLIASFRRFQAQHPTFFAFYVGRGDSRFRAENEQLDRELTAARVPHRFQTYPGAHAATVWRAHATAWLALAVHRLAPASG